MRFLLYVGGCLISIIFASAARTFRCNIFVSSLKWISLTSVSVCFAPAGATTPWRVTFLSLETKTVIPAEGGAARRQRNTLPPVATGETRESDTVLSLHQNIGRTEMLEGVSEWLMLQTKLYVILFNLLLSLPACFCGQTGHRRVPLCYNIHISSPARIDIAVAAKKVYRLPTVHLFNKFKFFCFFSFKKRKRPSVILP